MLSLTSPVRTPYHAIPASAKLATLCLGTMALFATDDLRILGGASLVTVAAYAVCGRQFMLSGLRMLRPIWFFVAVVLVWHIWTADLPGGAAVSLRLFASVAGANLVTATTRLDDMIDVVTRLAQPLRRTGLSVGVLGFAVGLVIRFTPVLIDTGSRLAEAWRSRSAKRPRWNIIFPLVVLALDDADQVAEALRARGGINADN